MKADRYKKAKRNSGGTGASEKGERSKEKRPIETKGTGLPHPPYVPIKP